MIIFPCFNFFVHQTKYDYFSGGIRLYKNTLGTFVNQNNQGSKIPITFILFQKHPNSFNPSTTIEFQLPNQGKVEISIYNSLGQLIRVFDSKNYSAGAHSIEWDGRDDLGNEVVSGIYFYNLKAGDSDQNGAGFSETRKMLLIR